MCTLAWNLHRRYCRFLIKQQLGTYESVYDAFVNINAALTDTACIVVQESYKCRFLLPSFLALLARTHDGLDGWAYWP